MVSKLKVCQGDGLDNVCVIQRCRGSVAATAIPGEVGVTEAEGLGACVGGAVGVFSWLKEPEEGDDTEVGDMAVELPMLGVIEVKDPVAMGVVKLVEDDGVDRVDASGGSILIFEGGEVSAE